MLRRTCGGKELILKLPRFALLFVLLLAGAFAQELPPLVLTAQNLQASILLDNNENSKANPSDTILVSWDNSAAGDNNPNDSIVSVTVDFSAINSEMGAVAANDAGEDCDAAADNGIWTACQEVVAGSVDGADLSFIVMVINSLNEVAQAATSETVFVDNQIPELISARTIAPARLEVTFSEAIDAEALEADGTDFMLNSDEQVITAASADGNTVTLTISPGMPTDFSTSLTIGFGDTIQDLAGNILTEGFVDVEDGMAPLFVSARTVSEYELEVVFSEAIADDDLWIEDILVDELSVNNLFLDESDAARLWIELDEPLLTGATPFISIYEDGNGVADMAGNTQYEGSVVAADGIAPQLVSVTATTPTTITVTFSEDLEESALVADDFVVYRTMAYDEELGSDVPVDPITLLSLGELDGVVTLTLEEPLRTGDYPQVELHPGEETAIMDWGGNTYAQQNDVYTVLDAIPPRIVVNRTVVLAQAGEEVLFSIEASDVFAGLNGDPWWDFGDGSGGDGFVVSHAFETGVYEVIVHAIDYEQETTETILVIVGDSPVTLDEAPDMSFAFAEIPPGTFELTADEENVTNISTAGFFVGSNFYEVHSDLSNGEFNVTITFAYEDLNGDGIVDDTAINELELGVYYHDGTSWIAVPNPVRDPEANTISVIVNHFTLFTLLVPEPPAPQENTGGGGGGSRRARPSAGVVPATEPPLIVTSTPAPLPAAEEEPTAPATAEAAVPQPEQAASTDANELSGDLLTGAATIGTNRNSGRYWVGGLLAVVAALLGLLFFARWRKRKMPGKSPKK
ncbi:MAG: Ig-like domain-containing protein [Nanoarchaeota archaeon]|nr:Ig-like domain-containing protein [Nanoarchaeota archaeon]